MRWGLGILAAGTVVLSVAPQLPVRWLLNPALAALGMGAGVEVSWFGLTGAAGTWWTTAGLVLALVSLVAGAVVYLLVAPARTAQGAGALAGGGVFTGGEPLLGDGRLPASDFSAILRQHWAPAFRWLDVDRAYLAAWEGLRRLAAGAERLSGLAEGRAAAWTAGLAALVLVGAALADGGPEAVGAAAGPFPLPVLLPVGCAAACAALCLASLSLPTARRHAPLMALAGAAAVAGLLTPAGGPRLVLLEAASALALLLVWRAAQEAAARWTYLAVLVLSAVALAGGELLLHAGQARWARALLLTGFLVKLGAVPLFLWLPRIARALPALVLGLVVAVVDVAAFGELWAAARAEPWLAGPGRSGSAWPSPRRWAARC